MNNCDDEEMNQKHSSWEHARSYVQNWSWSRNTFHTNTAGIKRKYTHYTTTQLYRITSTMRTNTQVNSCTSMTSCLNHETQTTGDCSYCCWVVVMLGYILAGLLPIMWWWVCSCLHLTGAEKPHKCCSKDVQTTLPEPLWSDKETWLRLPEIKQKLTNQHTCLVKEQKSSSKVTSHCLMLEPCEPTLGAPVSMATMWPSLLLATEWYTIIHIRCSSSSFLLSSSASSSSSSSSCINMGR